MNTLSTDTAVQPPTTGYDMSQQTLAPLSKAVPVSTPNSDGETVQLVLFFLSLFAQWSVCSCLSINEMRHLSEDKSPILSSKRRLVCITFRSAVHLELMFVSHVKKGICGVVKYACKVSDTPPFKRSLMIPVWSGNEGLSIQ